MKNHLKMKHTAPLLIALFGVLLIIGFQNCSNPMSFDGSGTSLTKSGLDATPNLGDGETDTGQDPHAVVNPPPTGEDDDLDTDIDYDHDGRRMAFNCITGARHTWNEADFATAGDLTLKNSRGFIFLYRKPLKNVFVANIQGSIGIHNAWRTSEFTNVNGPVSSLRSAEVIKASQIEAGVSSTAAVKLNELTNVAAGFICASGAEIGKISNLQGLLMKIRGRQSTTTAVARAHAQEISNLRGAFISIAQLDVAKIDNVDGELIIRDADIEELSNIRGGLTLINVRVKVLKNVEGILRTHNADIATQENVNVTEVSLPVFRRRP